MSRNKKYAFIIGYNGTKFHGCQINNTVETVEKAFIEGLVRCNAIKATSALDPSKIGLQRCSRTDSGVHAAMNVFVAKSCVPPEDFFSDLNDTLLEKDMMLYKICRLPKSFNVQRKCDYRIYEYVIPTFLFQESKYSEDLKKIGELVNDINSSLKRETEEKSQDVEIDFTPIISQIKDSLKTKSYRLSDILKMEIIDLFKKYVGTKDYTNFTSSTNDKGTSRHIKTIDSSETFVVDDVEYLRVRISGQSFLYNQIRNMVAYVIEYVRYRSIEQFDLAFIPNKEIKIFKAPSQFLLLNEIIFDTHNCQIQEDQQIKVVKAHIEDFKRDTIYKDVFNDKNVLWIGRWIVTMCTYTNRN